MFKKLLVPLLATAFSVASSSAFARDINGVPIQVKKKNRDILAAQTTNLKSSFNSYEALPLSDGSSINYVHRHLIIAIDGSNSISSDENALLLDGISHAIVDEGMNYNNCYAMTAIRFSEESHISPTHVFCSMQGAKEFVAEALSNKGIIFNSELGVSTDVTSAIIAAGYVWAGEGNDLNFVSNYKDLIVVGDGPDNIKNPNQKPEYIYSTKGLAQRFGATTHAVAVMTPHTQNNGERISKNTEGYYKNTLLTQRHNNITYMNPLIHGAASFPVRPGHYSNAQTFSDVSYSLGRILKAAIN